MPYEIQWNTRGTVTRFQGVISIEEINHANDDHYASALFDELEYQLYDFSQADLSALELEDAREPAAIDSAASSYKRHFKVALVSHDKFAEALFTEYKKTLKRFGSEWAVESFSSPRDAMAWCESLNKESLL